MTTSTTVLICEACLNGQHEVCRVDDCACKRNEHLLQTTCAQCFVGDHHKCECPGECSCIVCRSSSGPTKPSVLTPEGARRELGNLLFETMPRLIPLLTTLIDAPKPKSNPLDAMILSGAELAAIMNKASDYWRMAAPHLKPEQDYCVSLRFIAEISYEHAKKVEVGFNA